MSKVNKKNIDRQFHVGYNRAVEALLHSYGYGEEIRNEEGLTVHKSITVSGNLLVSVREQFFDAEVFSVVAEVRFKAGNGRGNVICYLKPIKAIPDMKEVREEVYSGSYEDMYPDVELIFNVATGESQYRTKGTTRYTDKRMHTVKKLQEDAEGPIVELVIQIDSGQYEYHKFPLGPDTVNMEEDILRIKGCTRKSILQRALYVRNPENYIPTKDMRKREEEEK